MHSGFHFASRRSTHRNVLMTSDFGTVTFADYRYDRRTLTWQCFIMFYLETNASSTVNRNLTEHAALGMQVGKI